MKGLLLVLLSSLMYGAQPSLRALAVQAGAMPVAIIAVNSFVFFLLAALICLLRRQTLRIPWRMAAQLLFAGGIGVGITGVLLTVAANYIPVGCATVIHFMYPSLVCVVMAARFHSRLTPQKLLAIALSLVGLLCISGDSLGGSLGGVALALCSSVTFMVYVLILDRGKTSGISQSVRMFYISLGSCLIMLGLQLATGAFSGWNGASLGNAAGCGVLTCIASFSFAAGIRRIGASAASFCSLFEPVSSLVISTALYHYAFSVTAIIGCALSVAAILLVSLGDLHASEGRRIPENAGLSGRRGRGTLRI